MSTLYACQYDRTMLTRSFPFLLLTLLAACGPAAGPPLAAKGTPVPANTLSADVEAAREALSVAHHFPGTAKDSLLANLITFIDKRPAEATNMDCTLPRFRAHYVAQLPRFTYAYHQMTADSTHWFYLIRPARSIDGDKRGVGGRFRVNANLELVELLEVFNTRVMPEEQLWAHGLDLFRHMVAHGGTESHPQRTQWVEWPDERLQYHPELRAWRYVD